jgi:hypothetical protein
MPKDAKNLKVAVGALRLVEERNSDHFQFAVEEKDGEKKRNFRMVGYSGGVIKNHWFWGDLAIDLEGLKFDHIPFPILRDHDTNREIGFSSKPEVGDDGLLFTDKEVKFLDTEEALKFLENAEAGFPYQASIYAVPSVIERVEEGESVDVNGFKLKGPGTVWRKAALKECSVCVFGYDDQTSSQVFHDQEGEVELKLESVGECFDNNQPEIKTETGGSSMNKEQFKADHPEIYAEIEADSTADVTAKFSKDIEAKDKEIENLTASNTQLTEANDGLGARVQKLEKTDALRAEEALGVQANSIVSTKLSESGIPERLHAKVRGCVSHQKFVGEDGKLDIAAFTESVETEIADWEDNLGEPVEGLGLSHRSVEGDDANQFTDDKAEELANDMAAHVRTAE